MAAEEQAIRSFQLSRPRVDWVRVSSVIFDKRMHFRAGRIHMGAFLASLAELSEKDPKRVRVSELGGKTTMIYIELIDPDTRC